MKTSQTNHNKPVKFWGGVNKEEAKTEISSIRNELFAGHEINWNKLLFHDFKLYFQSCFNNNYQDFIKQEFSDYENEDKTWDSNIGRDTIQEKLVKNINLPNDTIQRISKKSEKAKITQGELNINYTTLQHDLIEAIINNQIDNNKSLEENTKQLKKITTQLKKNINDLPDNIASTKEKEELYDFVNNIVELRISKIKSEKDKNKRYQFQ